MLSERTIGAFPAMAVQVTRVNIELARLGGVIPVSVEEAGLMEAACDPASCSRAVVGRLLRLLVTAASPTVCDAYDDGDPF